MNRFVPIGLQPFHHLLARQQFLRLLFYLPDVFNLIIQFFDFGGEHLIAPLLLLDAPFVNRVDQQNQDGAQGCRRYGQEYNPPLARGPFYFAMRKQVDAYHASNLRMAKPQATISAGASWVSWRGLIRDDRAILEKGLAMIVCVCV